MCLHYCMRLLVQKFNFLLIPFLGLMVSINANAQDTITNNHSDYVLGVIRNHVLRNPPSDSFKEMLVSDTTILQVDHYVKSGMLSRECNFVRSNFQHVHGQSLMPIAKSLRFNIRDLDVSLTLKIITQPGEFDQVYYENGIYWIKFSSVEAEVEEPIEEVIIEPLPAPKLDSNYILAIIQRHAALKLPTQEFKKTKASDTTILQIDHYVNSGMYSKECIIVRSDHQHLNGEKLMGIANKLQFSTNQLDLSFELEIVTYPGKENKVYFENGIYLIEYISPTD